MKLHLDRHLRTGLVSTHNGVEHQWHTKTWNKVKWEKTELVFGYLNSYWEKQSKKFNDELFALYEEAHEVFLLTDDENLISQKISEVAVKILDMHSLDAMRKHIYSLPPTHSPYVDPDTMKDDYGTNPEAQTYTKNDYLELVVLSTILKAMTPLWGSINHVLVPIIGKDHKEMACLDLIRSSWVMQTEAMKKLARFTHTWVESAMSRSQAAITKDIASIDLPYYFLAMNVVRRMPIQRFRNINGEPVQTADVWQNLIRQIYNFTDGGKNEIYRGPTIKKGGGGEGEEQESIIEQCRIAQRVPDYIFEVTSAYVEDVERFARDVIPMYNPEVAEILHTNLRQLFALGTFTMSDFHPVIFGKTVNDAIHFKSTMHMDRKSLLCVIAVSATVLKLRGYNEVAALIMAQREKSKIDSIQVGGILMTDLPRDLKERLNANYPHPVSYTHLTLPTKA